jgi:hypothetical protein
LFSSSCNGKRAKRIAAGDAKKRRAPLQTTKPDQVTCFQSVARKISKSRRKVSGNLTNALTGGMLFPPKCGNCEQSANGSERANESGEQGSTGTLKE